ncbi:MAG: integrase family protein [Acidobacteriaceae bacterium]|nr:integrase family protein [Acidobacteriaceae bacterium]
MTVSLWIRERVGGKRTYRKPNKKKTYPEGTVFCLRYSAGGKRRWETLNVNGLTAALAARATKEAALLSVPMTPSRPAKRINVDDAISGYLRTVAATLAHKTWLAYSLALTEFRKACTKEWLDQIDRSDLTALVMAQKQDGQDDRTVANRVSGVVTFLRAHGNVTVTLRPKYTEKKVKAYSVEELRGLNTASTDEELQIWQFFLGTGFREDEVSHSCDTDVDFKLKTISVLEKRKWNWKPKDKEERTVPIPDSLLELLKVRKVMHPDGWLIFPNTEGNPQGHFLRMLKERALDAGLNCGHCTGMLGGKEVSCKNAACCEHWILHRFRKTFATFHHANGVPARTIQQWLGHESLETTLRYLADAELGSEKTRTQVNGSFAEIDRV